MQYRNGREPQNGDKVIQLSNDGKKIISVGIVYDITTDNTFCDPKIAPIQNTISHTCISDCLHVEDVLEILKEKGLTDRV